MASLFLFSTFSGSRGHPSSLHQQNLCMYEAVSVNKVFVFKFVSWTRAPSHCSLDSRTLACPDWVNLPLCVGWGAPLACPEYKQTMVQDWLILRVCLFVSLSESSPLCGGRGTPPDWPEYKQTIGQHSICLFDLHASERGKEKDGDHHHFD